MMFEVLLTRIFSVTMWYHFAFFAISVSMFGLTAGAMIVFLLPGFFSREKLRLRLFQTATGLFLTIPAGFLNHLCIPFTPSWSVLGVYSIALTVLAVALPFVFGGMCITLALTSSVSQTPKLYAADLCGAAAACISLYPLLSVADAPTAIFAAAAVAGIGAVFFANSPDLSFGRRIVMALVLVATIFIVVNAIGYAGQNPAIRVQYVKDKIEETPLFESWNLYSRVTVSGDPDVPSFPKGWGLSSVVASVAKPLQQLTMRIDSFAATFLTRFDGNLSDLEFLKYDVTNLVHFLRASADVLVIGVGGGRDILSALVFGQKSVTGVEVNTEILKIANDIFGDFTGHLDRIPNVRIVNDEARAFLSRASETYDILQISLIDTWAATAAGAYVLSENALYTMESWKLFLDRLKPDGILSVTRWYLKDRPAEIYRLVALAAASLRSRGITKPADHLLLARSPFRYRGLELLRGMGTLLVSPTPFSPADRQKLGEVGERMLYETVLGSSTISDPNFAAILEAPDLDAFGRAFPMDITPPTDERPFFFNFLPLRDFFDPEKWGSGLHSFNLAAVALLVGILVAVTVLTLLCILLPLWISPFRPPAGLTVLPTVYFAGIGLGYLLVEIAVMQKFNLFLGHPVYSLTVCLFTLLLASGLGSQLSERLFLQESEQPPRVFLWLLGILALTGLVLPPVLSSFQSAETPVRIVIAGSMLFPMGLFMGMPFPVGLGRVNTFLPGFLPWFWGINGAASICASVLAIMISMQMSISATFWVGFSCYLLAALSLWRMPGKQAKEEASTPNAA